MTDIVCGDLADGINHAVCRDTLRALRAIGADYLRWKDTGVVVSMAAYPAVRDATNDARRHATLKWRTML